jgi:hypothetical protein
LGLPGKANEITDILQAIDLIDRELSPNLLFHRNDDADMRQTIPAFDLGRRHFHGENDIVIVELFPNDLLDPPENVLIAQLQLHESMRKAPPPRIENADEVRRVAYVAQVY